MRVRDLASFIRVCGRAAKKGKLTHGCLNSALVGKTHATIYFIHVVLLWCSVHEINAQRKQEVHAQFR